MRRRNIIILILLVLLSVVALSVVAITLYYKEGLSKNIHIKNIQIIYYAFLKKEKWRNIVLPQMQDLVDCGVLSEADLLIALSGEKELMQEAEMEIRRIIDTDLVNLRFTYTEENLYEYPGIKALYEESIVHPEKIYLYFHSKGMFFHDYENGRHHAEMVLFDTVVKPWKNALEIFNKRPEINKVCYGCSEQGFCWYNFYWVRGEYVARLDAPIITEDRYYYESYIGEARKQGAGYKDCYNIISNSDKPYFQSHEVNI
jgi:hypothetical protein